MDFQTMQDRTYAVLRDGSKAFVLVPEVQGWLNEANLELAKRLRVLRASVGPTSLSAGQSTITLPADLIEVETLTITGGTGFVGVAQFVTDPYFNTRMAIGGTPAAMLARVFGNNIEIFPVASGTPTYTLRYLQAPVTMVNPTDVSSLPASLHPKVVNYARAHAKFKENEFDAGDRYMALYEQGLPPAGADAFFSPFVPIQPSPAISSVPPGPGQQGPG